MKNAPFVRFLSITLTLSISLPAAYAHEPVYARKGIVVAQEPVAADVGVAVLKSGGNAVDAGVAVGFALAVTHPFAGNIGGGGFMLIRLSDFLFADALVSQYCRFALAIPRFEAHFPQGRRLL